MIRVFISAAVAVGVSLSSVFAQEPPRQIEGADGPCLTGLPPFTQEEAEWLEQNALPTKAVKLNKIGLARVNEERGINGLAPLSTVAVAFGEEVVTSEDALEKTILSSVLLPSYVDNSLLKYFPPIRDQGATLTCGAFSGAYYAMTHMWAMANDLDAKTGGDAYRLSPKFAYNLAQNGEDVGIMYYAAYNLGMRHGCASWEEVPFDSDVKSWPTAGGIYRSAINRRFQNWGTVSVSSSVGVEMIKTLLTDGYVLNFATYIYSLLYMDVKDDIYTLEDDMFVGQRACSGISGTAGYHGMTIVGYNDHIWIDLDGDNVVDADEKGAFKVANSWGTTYCNDGFVWLSYKANVFNPTLLTWVTVKAGYRPKMLAEVTVSHTKRNQLRVALGISDPSVNTPDGLWVTSCLLAAYGGAYSFYGTDSPSTMTCYLDYTDLVASLSEGPARWYLSVQDTVAGDEAGLLSFNLYKVEAGGDTLVGSASGLPLTLDNAQVYSTIDHAYYEDNSIPTAENQIVWTAYGTPKEITLNGSDPDYDSLTYQVVSQPEHGTLSGTGKDQVYTPAGGYKGPDSFTFRANDGKNDSGVGTVSIVVDSRIVAIPSGLSASDGDYLDKVHVAWDPVEYATHYRVFRASTLGGQPSDLSGWIETESFDDLTAETGQTYYYSVQASIAPSQWYAGYLCDEDAGSVAEEAGLWAGAAELGGGWRWLSWFGYFCVKPNSGWIYHNEHGWMYSSSESTAALWLYNGEHGWLYTTDSTYPSIWSDLQGAWMWYEEGSSNPRWFFNFVTEEWEMW